MSKITSSNIFSKVFQRELKCQQIINLIGICTCMGKVLVDAMHTKVIMEATMLNFKIKTWVYLHYHSLQNLITLQMWVEELFLESYISLHENIL